MSEIFRDEETGHDAKLAALYRTVAREEPPPALDDAIRAAARRAVASRPQRVSTPFIRSWRIPLSIAAVMVLTVSLVTVMREEAPEMVLSPGGLPGEADQTRAGPAADTGESATAVPKTLLPHVERSDSVGLRPPAQTGSSGIGLRDNRVAPGPAAESRKDMAAAGHRQTDVQSMSAPARRAQPEAFPGADGARDNKVEAPSASPAGSSMAEATQSRAELAPEKWLERIEELRRQGRFEEARTSLAEFRKRFPNHELPASFKEWAGP